MPFDPTTMHGFGLDTERAPVSLKDRFIIPPFSVLRVMDGDWLTRRRAWLALGIQSELGRGDHVSEESPSHTCDYATKQRGDGVGLPRDDKSGLLFKSQNHLNEIMDQRRRGKPSMTTKKGLLFGAMSIYDGRPNQTNLCGTSIFDPVLCELAYRWWCPQNGAILDPFAGGSVRGIVASMLERRYTGIDLRAEQIDANKAQWDTIGSRAYALDKPAPTWIVGDSQNILRLAPGNYDFIFSCPPYGDLEVYSDDSADLSTMSHDDFIKMYRIIIARSCSLLKDNRFACFVVGDFRDKLGFYRNFVVDTIRAFEDAGMRLYNEGILVTAFGSLPFRTKRQFYTGRKLGKTHQNILVFFKGDPKKIKDEFGENF